VHWVATQDVPQSKNNLADIIKAVHNWSERKSNMKPAHIKSAWETLGEKGWLDRVAQA
jgi:hypothetical protein